MTLASISEATILPVLRGKGSATSARLSISCACLAFLLAWLCPYHTYPYWSFYHDYLCLIGITLAILVYFSSERVPSPIVPRVALVPVAFALIVLTDALLGRMPARWDAVLPIGYLVAAAGAIVFATNLVRNESHTSLRQTAFNLLSAALCGAGVLSAFITFAQYLGVDDLMGDLVVVIGSDGTSAVRPYANLGQPNQLALILCWSLAATWQLFQARWLRGWLTTVISVVLLMSLALTQSKIAWLIVPMLFAVSWWAGRRPELRPVSRNALVLLAVLFVVMIYALPYMAQFTGTMTEGVEKRLETNGVRLVMIEQGFYISFLHPLFGVGWNAFSENQLVVASRFSETQYAMHSHNLIGNLAAEVGWPVTLAFIGLAAIWFHTRIVRKSITASSIFVAMILGALLIHSMVEFPLWYAYVLIPVALLIGLVEGGHEPATTLRIPRTAMIAVTFVGATAMILVASDYRRLVQSFRALGYERIGWTYADGTIDKPAFTAFPHFYDYIAFADVRPTIQMTEAQIATAEGVARRFAYAPVLMRLAMIYALNGRQDDALRVIDESRHLYPQRYRETYESWKGLAGEYPEVLGKVYAKLPPPPPAAAR